MIWRGAPTPEGLQHEKKTADDIEIIEATPVLGVAGDRVVMKDERVLKHSDADATVRANLYENNRPFTGAAD